VSESTDRRSNIEARTTIQPEFYDLDPMNVVWHGNYVRYLEVARCVLLEQIGYGYQEMQRSGYAWPVISPDVNGCPRVRASPRSIPRSPPSRAPIRWDGRSASSGCRTAPSTSPASTSTTWPT
jgi:hypothetical protein